MSANGMMQTVAWTQLAQAMRADGMSVSDTCPPHIAAFIRETVTALASDTGGRGVVEPFSDEDSLRQQASAWETVCATLDEGGPDWRFLTMRGKDSAAAAIRALRAQPAGGGDVNAADRFDQYVASLIDKNPDVRKLGERLAHLLESDDFNNIEPILLGIAAKLTPPESGGQGEAVRWEYRRKATGMLVPIAEADRGEWSLCAANDRRVSPDEYEYRPLYAHHTAKDSGQGEILRSKLSLKVGDKVRDREGGDWVGTVEAFGGDCEYPFKVGERTYTADGRYNYSIHHPSDNDIAEVNGVRVVDALAQGGGNER